ncbi:hypothetical protein [Sphingomonas sp.]|jgi:hypothetical protein|uniref:hypothetical protein n=1 Tax=Sphingomonas sp. TaxID=28214 RepID=UPI002E0E40BA|nr:hypothetical protein [Sphingomonas sp.]
MTPDQERWAEALAVERLHGALALAGDSAGVARFRQIAAKLESIQRASRDG